jgi:hypothetical protein
MESDTDMGDAPSVSLQPPPPPTPPPAQRQRSASGRGGSRGGGRGGRGGRAAVAAAAVAAAAATAAQQASAFVPPPVDPAIVAAAEARAAARWSVEEHAAFLAALWRFGLRSVRSTDSSSNDSSTSDPATQQQPAQRILRAHSRCYSAVPSKSAAQVDAYSLQFVWELLHSCAFVAPLLEAAGTPGFVLAARFLDELASAHPSLAIAAAAAKTDPHTPSLATMRLWVPSASGTERRPAHRGEAMLCRTCGTGQMRRRARVPLS